MLKVLTDTNDAGIFPAPKSTQSFILRGNIQLLESTHQDNISSWFLQRIWFVMGEEYMGGEKKKSNE